MAQSSTRQPTQFLRECPLSDEEAQQRRDQHEFLLSAHDPYSILTAAIWELDAFHVAAALVDMEMELRGMLPVETRVRTRLETMKNACLARLEESVVLNNEVWDHLDDFRCSGYADDYEGDFGALIDALQWELECRHH